jgi:hypothetical protein
MDELTFQGIEDDATGICGDLSYRLTDSDDPTREWAAQIIAAWHKSLDAIFLVQFSCTLKVISSLLGCPRARRLNYRTTMSGKDTENDRSKRRGRVGPSRKQADTGIALLHSLSAMGIQMKTGD